MPESRKLRVFLCHASQDKPVVRALYQRLLDEGWIDPWLDEEKLLPGQDWDMEIEQAVEVTDAVIVCLSENSISKAGYINKEILKILDVSKEKPEGRIFLIPLRLENCSPPHRLKGWQYVDYFPEEYQSAGYQKVLSSLENCGNVIGIENPERNLYPVGTNNKREPVWVGAGKQGRINRVDVTGNHPKISEMNSNEIVFGDRISKTKNSELLSQRLKEFYKWFSFGRYDTNEQIYFITSPSWVELLNRMTIPLLIIISSLVGTATVFLGKILTWPIFLWLFFGIVGWVALQNAYKSWIDIFYILTNYRILSTKRFRSGKMGVNESLDIIDLHSVGVATSVIDRIMDTGTVTFSTFSKSFEIPSVDNPQTVSWIVEGIWRKLRKSYLPPQRTGSSHWVPVGKKKDDTKTVNSDAK